MDSATPRPFVLEPLANPPIVEVVCGVYFEEIPELDLLMLGKFWSEVATEYPNRSVLPAVRDDGFVLASVPPLRGLMFSADKAFLLQVQTDRFYFNWRRETFDAEYPRFSDRSGKPGVGVRAFRAFERFSAFCRQTIGREPKPVGIELAKVDVVVKGRHWSDFADLCSLLPWLATFHGFSQSATPEFSVRFSERRGTGKLAVAMTLGAHPTPAGAANAPAVKLESKLTRSIGSDAIVEAFASANSELNQVFATLVPDPERTKRFDGGQG